MIYALLKDTDYKEISLVAMYVCRCMCVPVLYCHFVAPYLPHPPILYLLACLLDIQNAILYIRTCKTKSSHIHTHTYMRMC